MSELNFVSLNGSSSPQPGSIASFGENSGEFARLIHIIEESDSTSVGQIFRAIQDGGEQQRFMDHLNNRIAEHDRDIERMCNFHYQGFVDSIGELLKVRKHAEKLKEGVLSTNKALQRSGQPVIQQADELDKTRRTQHNIVATVENLQLCLPVLEMYCKLNEQMANERYYPALKTLEQLEHTYLPRVKRYRFCEEMADNIPKLREGIKEASMSDLKDFLESIRKHSDWIGEEAMKQVHKVISLELIFLKRSGKFHSPKRILHYTKPVISHHGNDEDGGLRTMQPKLVTDTQDNRRWSTSAGEKARILSHGVGQKQHDATNLTEDDGGAAVISSKRIDPDDSKNPFDDGEEGRVQDGHPKSLESEDTNPFASDMVEENLSSASEVTATTQANDLNPVTEDDQHISNVNSSHGVVTLEDNNALFESTDSISGDDTNPFADNTGPNTNDTNPFADNTTQDADDTNPFADDTTQDADDTNPFVDDTTQDADETNPFADDTAQDADDTNPFADDTNQNSDDTNPFADDTTQDPDDTNPFADDTTQDADDTNPFADDMHQNADDTNHFAGNTNQNADDKNPFAETLTVEEQPTATTGKKFSSDSISSLQTDSQTRGPMTSPKLSVSLEGVTMDESCVEEDDIPDGTNPFDNEPVDEMTEVQRRSNIESTVFQRHAQNESSLIEADTNPFTEEIMEEEEVNAQDKVDFSPVYRCLHIYSVLGERDVFETYYRKQRAKQSKLAIQPQGNMYESLQHYQKFFYQILGFFVVEDHIMSTTDGLVTREYLDDLWNTSLAKITSVLRNNSAYCTDATLLLQVKDQIVLFSQTLNSYGFTTVSVYELLFELKDQYNEILMKKWVQIFSDIFDSDNYTAIVVQTEQEFNNLMRTFPFSDESIEKTSFPKRLPFSEFVPKVYHQIKEFIYACHKFSQDLHLAQTERDDMIRKSTNILLTRTLSGCLSELIKRDSLGLTELVQVTVNTIHLENACEYLEDFISNITGTTGDNIHAQGLQSTNIFRDARSEAELEIYKRLNAKVDEFLELASYDWTLDESKGHASGYIQDVISFLEGSFKAFKHLPGKVAQTACLSTCKHLANSLMEFLLDDNVKFISMGAIQQFSLDVIQCELFANSEPVPGFREGALQMTFLELRQLLDLFMAWDWSSYLADYGQSNSKYSRVNPHTAIAILEKMKDTEKKKTFLPTFKKNERDRKKLMDMVLKQLKALVTGPPTSKAQAH